MKLVFNFWFFLGFALIAFFPIGVMLAYPPAKVLFQIMLSLMLFNFVRERFGDGIFQYLLAGILIYFLVFKYLFVSAPFYILQMALAFGASGIIAFGFARKMSEKW